VTTPVDTAATTVAAICARSRRSSSPALRTPDRTVSYHTLITDSYRAGNALRYLGVDTGDAVAVDTADPLRAIPIMLGAAQLGAVCAIGGAELEATVAVVQAPVADADTYERIAVYGAPPSVPTAVHWEATMWSENPAIHPVAVQQDWPVLADGESTWTQAEVMQRVSAAAPGLPAGLGPYESGGRVIDAIFAPLARGHCVELTS